MLTERSMDEISTHEMSVHEISAHEMSLHEMSTAYPHDTSIRQTLVFSSKQWLKLRRLDEINVIVTLV